MTKEIFTHKYIHNTWGNSESKSGPGSTVNANSNLLELLEEFINQNSCKSLTDCGCGDFNWMKLFNFNSLEKYTGLDIVDEMIQENSTKYSNDKICFKVCDLINDSIPKSDIIMCKDVLFHLSYADALAALENIKKSGSTYLISTTFLDYQNSDIVTGEWRPINLESAPFNLQGRVELWENIENRNDIYLNKSIGIWRIN